MTSAEIEGKNTEIVHDSGGFVGVGKEYRSISSMISQPVREF